MSDIEISQDQNVGVIRLTRPQKMNAMTVDMASALEDALAAFSENRDIRAVVLTGTGDRAFCAGTDINGLKAYDSVWSHRNRADYCKSVRAFPKPIIAAINGFALGGGLEMALSCDIRIGSTAARFGAPEIKLGWIGGGGMATYLAHAIGASNAALMLMTGDPIDAAKAQSWGLISELVERDALDARALDIAQTIASRAPIAAQMAKLNLKAAYSMPLDQAIQYELDLQAIASTTQDAKEGQQAFTEKRPAKFQEL